MSKTVYLAGAITGLGYEEARFGWRKEFADLVEAVDPTIEMLSPMRGKAHIKGYSDNDNPITGHATSGYVENVMSTGKGIVARDRWDTKRASLVVANLKDTAPGQVSIGTCIEFGWRDGHGPLVMICPLDDPAVGGKQHAHDHLMLLEIADFVCHSVEDAAVLTLKLLHGGV